MHIIGKAWKFGDNVDTDLIIPARFLNESDERVLGEKCFADMRENFSQTIVPGDIMVAGSNFGCGSSREHAPLAIRAAGVSVIIAKSFARIFYRNAFNIGLPILESEKAAEAIEEGDEVFVDLESGKIRNVRNGLHFEARRIPAFMQEIIRAGGLVNYIKEHGLGP